MTVTRGWQNDSTATGNVKGSIATFRKWQGSRLKVRIEIVEGVTRKVAVRCSCSNKKLIKIKRVNRAASRGSAANAQGRTLS